MLAIFVPLSLLPNAHAHNDYAHRRPLLDALDQGFLSVEIDVFLVDGEFRVGHSRQELKPGRTLETLYLEPLARRVKSNRGTVYGQKGVLTLLIDLKEDGARLEPELTKHLRPYAWMLSDRIGSTVRVRAAQVILSGARTKGCADRDGFLFKDGRVEDLADSAIRTPWVSGNYGGLLGSSKSPLPPEARARLADLVERTHASGKRLRLWGAPDHRTAWSELRGAGVDLLNTDRLVEMRRYLTER